MDLIDYSEHAGWPGSSTVWEFEQNQKLQIEKVSLLGGKTYILSGCEDDGAGNIANGMVVINGEIFPFVGGGIQLTVCITDTVTNKLFFGGSMRPFYHRRTVSFGTSGNPATDYTWSDFKRNDPDNGLLARVEKMERMLKPLMGYSVGGNTYYGSWLLWNRPASEIPAGWEAVPDAEIKGRVFVAANDGDADFEDETKSGGEKAHALAPNEQGSIKIKGKADDGDGDAGSYRSLTAISINGTEVAATGPGTSASNYGDEYTVRLNGDAAAHNNMPPYKVVRYIRFVG